MIDWLIRFDVELFLFLNSINSGFFDFLMYWISHKYIWIPFYALLFYLLARHYKWEVLLIVFFVIILIALSDLSSVHLFKNVFMRLRPCNNPEIMDKVHIVYSRCIGGYSFVSSHAANSFALAGFVIFFLFRKIKYIVPVMIIWASLKSYSRIYLGVHYPADIFGGMLLGIAVALVVVLLYVVVKKYIFPRLQTINEAQ